MRCPYCLQYTVSEDKYRETEKFHGVPIIYEGTVLHCSNPDCPEPDRYSAQELKTRKQQREAQLIALDRSDLIRSRNK